MDSVSVDLTTEVNVILVMSPEINSECQLHAGYVVLAIRNGGEVYDLKVYPFKHREYQETAEAKRDQFIRDVEPESQMIIWVAYAVSSGPRKQLFIESSRAAETTVRDLSLLLSCSDIIIDAVEAVAKDLLRRSVK